MLTNRGRLAVLLGLGLYLAGWAFGSQPLYPVSVGLLLAVALAWGWVRLLDRPMELHRVSAGVEHVEGDDVSVALELETDASVRPASLVVVDELRRVGEIEVTLRRQRHGTLTGRYVLLRLPRGRYPFVRTTAVLEDPFALERSEVDLSTGGALLVYPRLVDVDRLFSEAGAQELGGRRLLLRRPTGFDLHSVREYEQGESLRKVHWRSTARRGQLMVKELEDEPRDEVSVLLDAAAGTVAGRPPDSSFDMQVRAAGSILRAHARRGRRVALVVNSAGRESLSLRGEEGDWRGAMELLAAAEPNGLMPAAAFLGEGSAAGRAQDLALVTARLSADLVERVVQRAASRRGVAVVYVDAPSFVGKHGPPEPGLLRLQSLGIPVTVLRRGDDLAARLSAPEGAVAVG
ncbi:MAG TPA: DUF58 domain-containing protein [Gaiellaceae bacterium]|nr:DUF58 domain-containing protein [Gaiellaceae bacterium]